MITLNLPSLEHADVSLLFLQASGLGTILGVANKLPALKTIVIIGPLHAETRTILEVWSKQNNIKAFELTERTSIHSHIKTVDLITSILKLRQLAPKTHFHHLPSQQTQLLQSVTRRWVQLTTFPQQVPDSGRKGTTGNPKGAIITQGALAVSTFGCLAGFDIPANDTVTLLSYLPLAHIYEVMWLAPSRLSSFSKSVIAPSDAPN